MKNSLNIITIILLALFFGCGENKEENRLKPWAENSWYWQFKGKPVLLLGASNDDNLFQCPQQIVIPELDSMKLIGANYVRNTMSDRDSGNQRAFVLLENGKYDLNQWNDAYWQRFDNFLKETKNRDIIVQIEVWDRFDHSRDQWISDPFNPANNVNYTFEETGLDSIYPEHPGRNLQPFFFTTPQQQNNEVLLKYQLKFVDKMLSYSLNHDNVLYCIDNETSAEEKWAVFWAEYILNNAKKAEKEICVTEMWDSWDLKSEEQKRTFDHPERYAFCDVSQNNQQKGQVHWDNFQWVRNYISSNPRPLNTVKTYGADGERHGSTKDGLERWWRHILGGAASARFHRPTAGLGLCELSANSIKVAREIEKTVKFWDLEPANDLLSGREENEAYLVAKPGEYYVLFFTDGGEVGLDLSKADGKFNLKWYDVRKGRLVSESEIEGGSMVNLKPPADLEWVALLTSI